MSTPTDPWLLARDRYMEDLTEEEKKVFVTASLENLLYSAGVAQKDWEGNSKSRAISRRLEHFVAAIDQYGAALDIANAFEKYFERLIDMLARIGDVLPRCQVYQSLFPTHERLLQAISVAYLDIIRFCMDAKATFRKLRKSTTLNFALKMTWKDFNRGFGGTLTKFRDHVKNVDKEAGVSNMIEGSNERALAWTDRAANERQRKIERRKFLLSQLSSYRYIDKHLKERNKRHPRTSAWLTETAEFKNWITGDSSTCLWCYGIPGSGKTVLASSLIDTVSVSTTGRDVATQSFTDQGIIDEVITRQETAIAFYYCDFSDPKSLETRNILGTVIKELLEGIIIPHDLEQQIHRIYRPGTRAAGDSELASILFAVIEYFFKVYIFIDGLDECGNDEQVIILSVVNQLTQSRPVAVKIFITSRDEALISTSLREFPRLQVSADKNSSDIAAFIEDMVQSKIRSGELIQGSSLESEIISALIDGAQGMFLWVHFQLADLCEATSVFGIRETLCNLPKGMAETYTRVLKKIGENHSSMALAQRLFMWIVCAKRPLLITELGEAVAFTPTDRSWDADKIPETSRLIQACRSLVVLDDDKTARLAHHTVQQFLLELPTKGSIPEFHFRLSQADVQAGEICIAYLLFSDFETQITASRLNSSLLSNDIPGPAAIVGSVTTSLGLNDTIAASVLKLRQHMRTWNTGQRLPAFDLAKFANLKKPPSPSLKAKYAFLDYAIENWIGHTSNFSEDNTTMWRSFRYLAMDKPMPFDIRVWGNSSASSGLPYAGLFHWAIDAGHLPLLKLILQLPKGSGLHDYCRQEFDKGQSVVLNASSRGHVSVVKFLVEQDCIDCRDGNLLVIAAERGYDFTVRLLLEHELYLEAMTEALQAAARTGQAAVMRVLLENEPPFGWQDRWHKAALIEAAKAGHDEALVVLLSKGANFEVTVTYLEEEWGNAALHAAAERGLDGVMRLIIGRGTDIAAKDDLGGTALHWAAQNGHEAAVWLLIENGADINTKSDSGGTVLQWAALKGQEAIVRLLLEKGADIHAAHFSGGTALHWAAENGHEAVVRLLIEKGADIAAKDNSRWTALHWAAWGGYEEIVQILLEKGADVAAKTSFRGTALHLAAQNGHLGVVQLLVEKGTDVAAEDGSGSTAMQYAARIGFVAITQLLTKKGTGVTTNRGFGAAAPQWLLDAASPSGGV